MISAPTCLGKAKQKLSSPQPWTWDIRYKNTAAQSLAVHTIYFHLFLRETNSLFLIFYAKWRHKNLVLFHLLKEQLPRPNENRVNTSHIPELVKSFKTTHMQCNSGEIITCTDLLASCKNPLAHWLSEWSGVGSVESDL